MVHLHLDRVVAVLDFARGIRVEKTPGLAAPAGGTDMLSRLLGEKLGKAWGQQVGHELGAKAAPDGYTRS